MFVPLIFKGDFFVSRKVRTIWAGWVEVLKDGGEVGVEEWVVSGGFDKRLIVWKR